MNLARAFLARIRQVATPARDCVDLVAELSSSHPRLDGETLWVRFDVAPSRKAVRMSECRLSCTGGHATPTDAQCQELTRAALVAVRRAA